MQWIGNWIDSFELNSASLPLKLCNGSNCRIKNVKMNISYIISNQSGFNESGLVPWNGHMYQGVGVN